MIKEDDEEVDLTNTRQKDLSLVFHLKKLTELTLRQNEVSTLSHLGSEQCTFPVTLKHLDLYSNELSGKEIERLSVLTNLEYVDLFFFDVVAVVIVIIIRYLNCFPTQAPRPVLQWGSCGFSLGLEVVDVAQRIILGEQ